MSPRSKEQYEVIRRKSREAIRDVALDLFARYGYHSTSISQIAREAGVSKGLMYNYFESKEALLQAILSEAITETEAVLRDQLNGAADARSQLRGLTKATIGMVRSNLDYWKLLTALSLQPDVFAGMETIIQQKKDESMALIMGLFGQLGEQDPERAAYLYGAALDGLILHYMQIGPDAYGLDAMVEFFLQRFDL